jgi:hypothetical protein
MFAKKNGITTTSALAAMALPTLSQSEDSGNNELSVQALSSAGTGALVFDPQTFQGGNGQTRARSFIGGAFNFSRYVFVRAECRGFVYNSPTYRF